MQGLLAVFHAFWFWCSHSDSHGLEKRSPKDSDVEPKGRLRLARLARARRTWRVGGDVYRAVEGGSIRQACRSARGCAGRHAPPARPVITTLSGGWLHTTERSPELPQTAPARTVVRHGRPDRDGRRLQYDYGACMGCRRRRTVPTSTCAWSLPSSPTPLGLDPPSRREGCHPSRRLHVAQQSALIRQPARDGWCGFENCSGAWRLEHLEHDAALHAPCAWSSSGGCRAASADERYGTSP